MNFHNKPLDIVIKAIPAEKQRYPTTGDWELQRGYDRDIMRISVSGMEDWRYEALVGIHEAVEAILCYNQDIHQAEVDAFDIEFENSGKDGEPGDDSYAPYYKEHQVATGIERILAAELGVSWQKYEEACEEAHERRVRLQSL